MKTGRYRVRPSFLGKAVLQAEYDSPTLIGGHVDASLRQLTWHDVQFENLETIRFRPLKPAEESGVLKP